MSRQKVRVTPMFIAAVLLVLMTLACGSSVPTATRRSPTSRPGQNEPTQAPQNTRVPLATSTPLPTPTPLPTLTPTPAPIGFSRREPFPKSVLASVPDWDIQVLEVKRGAEAWNAIQEANAYNSPAPEGKEYMLVKLYVKSTHKDNEAHSVSSYDYQVTGDRLTSYTVTFVSGLEPELRATLFSGGETQGWVSYLVAEGETNLMLVVNGLYNFDSPSIRYLAIDDGASISIPPDLAAIQPNQAGALRSKPALRYGTVITRGWEITIKDVQRGEAAWNLITEENEYSAPPDEGMEYIVVKVHVRYIATEDKAGSMGTYSFKSTGSKGVLYDYPSNTEPQPALNISLYPGGEYEGWVTVQAAIGETGMMLVYEPLFDINGSERYISLEP
jgi:hypothetical protein